MKIKRRVYKLCTSDATWCFGTMGEARARQDVFGGTVLPSTVEIELCFERIDTSTDPPKISQITYDDACRMIVAEGWHSPDYVRDICRGACRVPIKGGYIRVTEREVQG